MGWNDCFVGFFVVVFLKISERLELLLHIIWKFTGNGGTATDAGAQFPLFVCYLCGQRFHLQKYL